MLATRFVPLDKILMQVLNTVEHGDGMKTQEICPIRKEAGILVARGRRGVSRLNFRWLSSQPRQMGSNKYIST